MNHQTSCVFMRFLRCRFSRGGSTWTSGRTCRTTTRPSTVTYSSHSWWSRRQRWMLVRARSYAGRLRSHVVATSFVPLLAQPMQHWRRYAGGDVTDWRHLAFLSWFVWVTIWFFKSFTMFSFFAVGNWCDAVLSLAYSSPLNDVHTRCIQHFHMNNCFNLIPRSFKKNMVMIITS